MGVGSEEITRFFVRVGAGAIGAETTPTGTVTIKAGSTVLCTIILVHGSGFCSPSADALPAGNYAVVADYSGDANYVPAQSRPRTYIVRSVGAGIPFGGGSPFGGGVPFGGEGGFLSDFFQLLFFGGNSPASVAEFAPGLRSHFL